MPSQWNWENSKTIWSMYGTSKLESWDDTTKLKAQLMQVTQTTVIQAELRMQYEEYYR